MTLKAKYLGLGIITATVFVVAFSLFYVAKANPLFFIRSSNTSTTFPTATTTQAFFANGGGLGTTTLAFDLGVGGSQGADGAALLIQLTSTTSQPVLNVDIQYSQDNVDWYQSPVGMDYQNYATSTVNIGQVQALQLVFASSTVNRSTPSPFTNAGTTTPRIVNIKTPTRYVRAVFYTAVGSAPAALWAEFVAKRQGN